MGTNYKHLSCEERTMIQLSLEQGCTPRAIARSVQPCWVTLLASDAYNMAARMPELEPGRTAAGKIVGEAKSWRLVRERPAAITAGNPGFGAGG